MGSSGLILLDTHMWVWFHGDSNRLPDKLIDEISNPKTRIGISVVTVWETMVAIEKGRIQCDSSPETTVRHWLQESPFEVFPLIEEIVVLSRSLRFIHEDPADRFIASTAYYLNCPLATVDRRLVSLPWLNVIA